MGIITGLVAGGIITGRVHLVVGRAAWAPSGFPVGRHACDRAPIQVNANVVNPMSGAVSQTTLVGPAAISLHKSSVAVQGWAGLCRMNIREV